VFSFYVSEAIHSLKHPFLKTHVNPLCDKAGGI
jgi:hypothetical protein